MTRVLVVDDEIDTLNLLRIILEISGFEAVTTLNSTDAITLAEVEHPDCVLLDIMMPTLDGFTLCRMMRLHPATANLPIVFVTAYSALDLEDRRKEAGADMVLPKPVGMDVLLETIGQATALRPKNGNGVKNLPAPLPGTNGAANVAVNAVTATAEPVSAKVIPPAAVPPPIEPPKIDPPAKPARKGWFRS